MTATATVVTATATVATATAIAATATAIVVTATATVVTATAIAATATAIAVTATATVVTATGTVVAVRVAEATDTNPTNLKQNSGMAGSTSVETRHPPSDSSSVDPCCGSPVAWVDFFLSAMISSADGRGGLLY